MVPDRFAGVVQGEERVLPVAADGDETHDDDPSISRATTSPEGSKTFSRAMLMCAQLSLSSP